MTFSEFANKLYPIIGGGQTTSEFVSCLFRAIIEFPPELEFDNPIDDQVESTFKSYYNGNRPVRSLAKKINPYIDVMKFEAYIDDTFADGVQFNLKSAFHAFCPGIENKPTAGEDLALLFQRILLEAVEDKKKTASPKKQGDGLKDRYGIQLVLEAQGICANDGCSRSLLEEIGGQTQLFYEIYRIDASNPETYENLIALCPTCYAKLYQGVDSATTTRLAKTKEKMLRNDLGVTALSAEKLEQGVEQVLEKILITPEERLVPLNYDPVPVRQKIRKEHNLLYIKVKGYVTTYFMKVDQWLKQMDKEGRQHFQPFCDSVKISYLKLSTKGLSQPEIFEQLVNWIQNNTNGDRAACEVVVAYFVQKCEVFDAVTE